MSTSLAVNPVATLTAKCSGFTRLESPLEKSLGVKNYYAIVDALNFFDLDSWRKTNVRDPKAFGRVPDAIRKSLNENTLFAYVNRGIIISAKTVSYNNQTNELRLELEDPSIHGLLDGGHSYLQIRKFMTSDNESDRHVVPQYVKVEILTGLDKDKTVDIADGRNTSNQVKEVSLEDLRDTFKEVKAALKGQPYENDIAYKEYETYDDNPEVPKPISVTEILKCLVCFDREKFTDEKHPTNIVTRGGENATIEYFRDNIGNLRPLLPLLPDILKLWDTILYKFGEAYAAGGGRLGALGAEDDRIFKPASRRNPRKLYFLGSGTAKYKFSDSLRLPILAAYRSALVRTKGKCTWRDNIEPAEHFSEVGGPRLTRVICESLKDTADATKTSRLESVWESCYDKVRISLVENN